MGRSKSRLDEILIEQGSFKDREAVLRAVIAGEVLVDDVVATSAAMMIDDGSNIRVKAKSKYVSRGGYKLKGALDHFSFDPKGSRCLDIGSSTGGFSDCLLQCGAKSVVCIDVNYGQLAWEIRGDERVTVFERTNIKDVEPGMIGAPFDLIVIDVSFIGLATLVPKISELCDPESHLLALVKPQFESKHDETINGVVMDEEVRLRTLREVSDSLSDARFKVLGSTESDLKGPAGNIEYFIFAKRS